MSAAVAPPPAAALAQVAYDMRACATAFSDAATVFRFGWQQTWTLDDLAARYRGYTRDQIIGLLIEHGGYQPEARNRQLVVHLDYVLAVDAGLRKALAR